jgi:O-methyltransferase
MDLIVHPGSRIAKLPKAARLPALLARNLRNYIRPVSDKLFTNPFHGFVYHNDGMATAHYSPFLEDPHFNEAYRQMAAWWWQGRYLDVRWRTWVLTKCAAQCTMLSGSFIEFGVYRAGYSFMILTIAGLRKDQRFFLFDTFQGVPGTNLTEAELQTGFGGSLADTSVAHVQQVLSDWSGNTVIVEGDIFDTLPDTETGAVAFCHLDLNASEPTKLALDYVYPRLLPSGMIVMDDYGYRGFEEQRAIIDDFFADKPEKPIALPTGQGLIVKLMQ